MITPEFVMEKMAWRRIASAFVPQQQVAQALTGVDKIKVNLPAQSEIKQNPPVDLTAIQSDARDRIENARGYTQDHTGENMRRKTEQDMRGYRARAGYQH